MMMNSLNINQTISPEHLQSNLIVENSNSTHVNIRLTIALAVPAESSSTNDSPSPQLNVNQNRRVSETAKIQGYYRIEYSLIPGEANIAFDIAVYRSVAKIYPDNQEGQIVLTWEDDQENVWIVWNHLHQLELTRERLSALLSHPILVKIWDGREYCTTRTKLDKPRIGRAMSTLLSNPGQENPTKKIVQAVAQNYADKWISKTMLYKMFRKLPIDIPRPSISLQRKIDHTESSRLSTASTGTVLREKTPDTLSVTKNTSIRGTSPDQNVLHGILKYTPDENATPILDDTKRKRGSKSSKQTDEKKEKGTAQILVPSRLIFAGFKTITCRLDDHLSLPKTIQDCLVSINIEDHQLLNEVLANEFNPLTITISHVENMPPTPIAYTELRQRCEPVYCCYQLFDQPMHQTERKIQARHIYWNDLNLVLTNLVDQNVMSQFCNSPILNIEIHDRDEHENSRRAVGSVFGSESTDEIIGKVSSKMNLLKPRTESNWHPHGCVKLDLSELWLGQTCFEFYIPVVPCHAPESGAKRGTNAKRLETLRIQQGDFLASGTQMQIQVKLAKPLVRPTERRLLDDRQFTTTTIAPFTRIVFVFAYQNTKFLTSIETSIRSINAKALDFDQHPAHVQIAALSTYKLTEVQESNPNLSIITGFHLFDDERHLFVLEGRKDEAIDILYKSLPKPEGQNVEILYDSSIHFNERLYIKLGVDLTHVKLCRTLRDIVSQPLIFVRDVLPKETFEALDKLHQLVHVHKLNASARYNLFPTIEMINALNRDFGVPLTEKEIKLFSTDDRVTSASTVTEKVNKNISNSHHSNHPSKQEHHPSSTHLQRSEVDFLSRNAERVRMASLRNNQLRRDQDHLVFTSTGPVYPYSTQKLNASENALEQMRTYLKQHHRSSSCSFNPDHRSGTYSPYSNEETVFDYHRTLRSPLALHLSSTSKEKLTEKSLSDWITYPGHRSSRQSNTHPKSLDPARLEELSKPPNEWFENNPDHRGEPFQWIDRKTDFDRYVRPSTISPSISTHWESTNDQKKNSNSPPPPPSNIVTDERMHFLRRSTQTEMHTYGRLSSTQLDRLTGLLKDKPVKKGLLLPRSYSRNNGAHSAPLTYKRSLSSTPDRRIRSSTTLAFRKNSQ